MEKKQKRGGLVDRLEGDKVVWIIVLMLILISIVCIFSSTSRLLEPGQTRLDIVWGQMKTVVFGLVVIFACYFIKDLDIFRWCAKWGFLLSLMLLVFLILGPKEGPIKSIELNGARRALSIFGKQVFVYEIVKVAMVMYLSWAVEAFKKKTLPFKFITGKWAQKIVFIYLPFILTTVLILPGSNSAALFIGGIMFLTIFIGSGEMLDAAALVVLAILGLGFCFGIYEISDHTAFKRIGTAVSGSRSLSIEDMEKEYRLASNTEERQAALDKMRQPYSAMIAVKEGGVLGKGPGQSTQRYAVPDISEDFMFSFIIEEYGLWGALIIIFLYVSLLARGSIIARNCGNDLFAKTAVAGLTLLISMQAFLHMFVNADIGPMTGQTLPLISHGNSAFLCFCVAFGVLLSISRIAQKKIRLEEEKAESLAPEDDIQESLNDLDSYDL